MTSVERGPRQIPVNALYTNIVAVQSSIFDATGLARAGWVTNTNNNVGALSTVGAAIFRDMGKTIYVPDPTVPTSVGSQSTILRKVQLVTGYYGTGANGTAGVAGAPGTTTEYYTGYIKLGGQTYGGGGDNTNGLGGVPSGFVRAN
jgi:hypothetical protein